MNYLYFAGMENDSIATEQIGLATSSSGLNFKRHGDDGLLLPVDSDKSWMNLRTCNPCVVRSGEKIIMFFQGITSDAQSNVSIGSCESLDGIHFGDPSLVLQYENFFERDHSDKRYGVIEPCIIVSGDTFQMWFIKFTGKWENGNRLCYCESKDGGATWNLISDSCLIGSDLGELRIHYPQVIKRSDGYDLYLTIFNDHTGLYKIAKFNSMNGLEWEFEYDLVPTFGGICNKLSYQIGKVMQGKVFLGCAHPHMLKDGVSMVTHDYWRSNKKKWMSINLWKKESEFLVFRETLLHPGKKDAWDEVFVGDPYIFES